MQILDKLAPLQLAKEHLPSDITDILERLGKADNIPFNQLYYIADNCADRYYSKVIQTFVSIIKRQFADRQTLLINTAHSLKFLEEYADRQAQIWKILHKYHNLLDDVDIHLHFNSFKSSIETNFKHLKEATSHNMQNIQTSLGVQQPYSSTLCSHINNIYNKLSKLQKHIQHHCMCSHQSDTVQIDAPEYDPDIDEDNQSNTDEKHETVSVQGALEMNPLNQRMTIVLPLKTTQSSKINKKPIGLMLPPSRHQVFLQQQISHRRLCTTDGKSSPLQKISKYLT